MRVKAVTTLSKKADAVTVSIFTYSSADTLKETLEDNMRKTTALKEYMKNNTPHKENVEVSFGRPLKKMVKTTNRNIDNQFEVTEQTEYQYNGYEMCSSITTEIPLDADCKFDGIYNESLKYTDCTINIEYTLSDEARAEAYKELRQKLIAEANKQMSELTDMEFEMVDFSYHCNIDNYDNIRYDYGETDYDMVFGAQKYSSKPTDKEVSGEYAAMVNALYSKDMAPTVKFSDEIIVEYIYKNSK